MIIQKYIIFRFELTIVQLRCLSCIGCCFSESVLAGVRLEIDGTDRGSRTIKIESTLSELEYLLKMNNDPIEFMCQVTI